MKKLFNIIVISLILVVSIVYINNNFLNKDSQLKMQEDKFNQEIKEIKNEVASQKKEISDLKKENDALKISKATINNLDNYEQTSDNSNEINDVATVVSTLCLSIGIIICLVYIRCKFFYI